MKPRIWTLLRPLRACKHLGAGLLLCSVGLWALAQAPSPAAVPAPASTPNVFTYTLSNGLQLWVRPDRRAPTAVHMVWLRVGALDEPEGTSGVAHVLEHMMFKGSAQLPAGEFSRRVAALGGRDNAFTAKDYTAYFQQIPASRLEEVMRLEADRLATNRWPDEEFKREIEVVKEERRLRTDDDPRASLHELIAATALTASPQRRPIIGWMDDLHAMTPEDVRAFYRRWYTPANALVVVAGDVQPEQVRELAERHYGRWTGAAVPPRKPLSDPPQKGLRRVEHKAVAEQAYVALAYRVPRLASMADAPEHRDALALTVLAAVLDGYSGARLERRLTQGPQRVADSVGASNGLMGRGPQFFYLDGVPAPGQTPEALEAALRAEVQRIAREGVGEAELARVKTQWVASAVYKLDSVFNQARELGVAWALGWPADGHEQLLRRLRQVSAEQVQAVAQKYLVDDALTVGILRPQPPTAPSSPRPAPTVGRHGGPGVQQ